MCPLKQGYGRGRAGCRVGEQAERAGLTPRETPGPHCQQGNGSIQSIFPVSGHCRVNVLCTESGVGVQQEAVGLEVRPKGGAEERGVVPGVE